jgi:hypothetical protein
MLVVDLEDVSSYWAKPKLAPAVQVESPEAERELRRDYPYDRPTLFRTWEGQYAVQGLSSNGSSNTGIVVSSILFIGSGWMAWKSREKRTRRILAGVSTTALGFALLQCLTA